MKKVFVLGDVMLDAYATVYPRGLSSEAPVVVALRGEETYYLGGAANAAALCRRMGSRAGLCGLVALGNDATTDAIVMMLEKMDIDSWLVAASGWTTILKRRYVTPNGQQLLRIDDELSGPCELSDSCATVLIRKLFDAAETYETLLISDYNKGVLDMRVALDACDLYHRLKRFCVVNAKPGNFLSYGKSSVIVMNLHEAEETVRLYLDDRKSNAYGATGMNGLLRDLHEIHTQNRPAVLVTNGEHGLSYYDGQDFLHVPAPRIGYVTDVTGAGDTIAASIAVAGEITPAILKTAATNAALTVAHGREASFTPGDRRLVKA